MPAQPGLDFPAVMNSTPSSSVRSTRAGGFRGGCGDTAARLGVLRTHRLAPGPRSRCRGNGPARSSRESWACSVHAITVIGQHLQNLGCSGTSSAIPRPARPTAVRPPTIVRIAGSASAGLGIVLAVAAMLAQPLAVGRRGRSFLDRSPDAPLVTTTRAGPGRHVAGRDSKSE